jgi:hypothetical protein
MGGKAMNGVVSATADALAEGVIKTMIRAKRNQMTVGILAVFAITITGWLVRAGQGVADPPRDETPPAARNTTGPRVIDPKAKPPEIAKELIGTWVLVGTPGQIGQPPPAGGMLKFFTGRHWTITQANPRTGVVVFHHGGTYKLDGDAYAETVEYAAANTANLIKQTYKFKIKIEGDTYTQTGIDGQWSQVWKRAK